MRWTTPIVTLSQAPVQSRGTGFSQRRHWVYFVLGNHDFYRGSIGGVRKELRAKCSVTPNLHWLPAVGIVPLTEAASMVGGDDGWGDGRLGNYHGSDVMLNDFGLIGEFDGFGEDPNQRLAKLHALGDEAAAHFRRLLPDALSRFGHVIAVTHEACVCLALGVLAMLLTQRTAMKEEFDRIKVGLTRAEVEVILGGHDADLDKGETVLQLHGIGGRSGTSTPPVTHENKSRGQN